MSIFYKNNPCFIWTLGENGNPTIKLAWETAFFDDSEEKVRNFKWKFTDFGLCIIDPNGTFRPERHLSNHRFTIITQGTLFLPSYNDAEHWLSLLKVPFQ